MSSGFDDSEKEFDDTYIVGSSRDGSSVKSNRKSRRCRRHKSNDNKHSAKRARTSEAKYEAISSSEDSLRNYPSTSRDRNDDRETSSRVLMYSDLGSQTLSESDPVSMITVCRLLAALETELGSLAPKALDLLAETIQANKQSPITADKILMTKQNSILLEMVKEKMKGLLMVEIYSTHKTAAIKNLIDKIDQLIRQSNDQVLSIDPPKLEPNFKQHNLKDIRTDSKAHGKEGEIATLVAPKISSFSNNADKNPGIFHVSDEELKTLFENFSELLKDEQIKVIKYLENLEKTDSSRVQRLQQYVNMRDNNHSAVILIDDDDDDDDCREAKIKPDPQN